MKKNGLFRYKEDRLPVLIILLLSAVDFLLYFNDRQHKHLYYLLHSNDHPKRNYLRMESSSTSILLQKFNTQNRILEFFYALHTGVTSHLWRLHHVLGHHLNFLDQTKDESRWKRKDGTQMGALEYTLNVAFTTAYPRGYKVGKHHPK